MHKYTHAHISSHARTHTRTHTCMHACQHTHTCMHNCILSIHTRQTETHMQTHTHAHTALCKDSYHNVYIPGSTHTVTYQGWLGSLVVPAQPPDGQERWRVPSHVSLCRLPSTTLHSNGLIRTLISLHLEALHLKTIMIQLYIMPKSCDSYMIVT